MHNLFSFVLLIVFVLWWARAEFFRADSTIVTMRAGQTRTTRQLCSFSRSGSRPVYSFQLHLGVFSHQVFFSQILILRITNFNSLKLLSFLLRFPRQKPKFVIRIVTLSRPSNRGEFSIAVSCFFSSFFPRNPISTAASYSSGDCMRNSI